MADVITIGSRGSRLALTQSRWVAAALEAVHPGLAVNIVEIKTTGDRNLGASLSELGGKGAFTKELEDAMLEGKCDIAVHSLKDLPTILPDGLRVLCTPAREDTRDVLISREALPWPPPPGAVIGSSSLRRKSQLHALEPTLKVIEFRGNVETRLRKLREGEADATLLAAAGLKRLGLLHDGADNVDGLPCRWLEPPAWLPAVGQGALGIEGRADDRRTEELLAPLHDAATFAATSAERAFLNGLGAGCQAPVGARATVEGDKVSLIGRVYSVDGQQVFEGEVAGPSQDAKALGQSLADTLKAKGAIAVL
jgi:hydroxymethylbilane synthase